MIDELSFRFENPGGRSLAGLYVTNDQSADLRWGPIEPCSPTLCAARFPPAAPAPETACIVEGTATSSSGTLRLFTKQYFLPSVSYRIALGDPANNGGPLTIVSNVAEASVIRMPGVRNDQVAFYDVVPNAPQRTGSDYVASGTAYFYFPPQLVASPYRTEVQFSWYHSDGRLFAMYRTIVGGLGIRIAGVSSSAPTNGRPPWRMVIRMRQTSGAADPNGVSFTCNNDRPYPGQARCTTDQLPAAPGPVLTEDSREALTAGI